MNNSSPFRSTAPSRARAVLLAAACFGVGVAAVASRHYIGGWFLGLVFLPFGFIYALAALVPSKFLLGVRIGDNQFEYRAPLRSPKVVPFSGILSIDAVCRGDGGAGDDIHWLIASNTGKVFIPERELLTSGLSKAIERSLTLDPSAVRLAYSYQPSGLDFIFGKRFRIYGAERA